VQVKCCDCGYESNTLEDFLDISLDISHASSLTKALARFTGKEYLDRENKYKCPKQGRLMRAVKQITIDRAPNVLVFQLKRFEYSMYGSKIGKKVTALSCPPLPRALVSPLSPFFLSACSLVLSKVLLLQA